MHGPSILFLDEPTSGVDPLTRREFWGHINAIAGQGSTVLVTTHFLDEAEYCDRIGIVNEGRLIATGSPDELKAPLKSPDLPDPTLEDAFVYLVQTQHRGAQRGMSAGTTRPCRPPPATVGADPEGVGAGRARSQQHRHRLRPADNSFVAVRLRRLARRDRRQGRRRRRGADSGDPGVREQPGELATIFDVSIYSHRVPAEDRPGCRTHIRGRRRPAGRLHRRDGARRRDAAIQILLDGTDPNTARHRAGLPSGGLGESGWSTKPRTRDGQS